MASKIEIVMQSPMDLDNYDRSRPAAEQHTSVPLPFLDCMAVREEVFVKGQNIPLLLEADSDDCRSYHWIAYFRDENGNSVPVGNIRMVIFPHDAHPLPGSSWDLPENPTSVGLKAQPRPWIVDRATSFHDGREAYLKLGRMAVIEKYRGRGIASLLVKSAIDWARQNHNILSHAGSKNDLGTEVDSEMTSWKGLICVHAQEYVEKTWASWGFQVDEKMGKWTEAGIPHVGMFLRVKLPLET